MNSNIDTNWPKLHFMDSSENHDSDAMIEKRFLQLNFPSQNWNFQLRNHGKNQASRYGKIWVWKSRKTKKSDSFFAFLDYQDFEAKMRMIFLKIKSTLLVLHFLVRSSRKKSGM